MTTGDRSSRGVVPVDVRAGLTLALVSLAGVVAFTWPLLIEPRPGIGHDTDAAWVFVVMVPVLVAIAVGELSRNPLDTRALAMIAVLAGVGAALRPLGAGTAGIETVFVVVVLGGRVMGPGFGFLLGSSTLFASALLTAGVGPWLPFQMLAAGWIGLGAGLLPRAAGRRETGMLVAFGVTASFAYGLAMNLWFWPFVVGSDSALSFVAGAPVGDNLGRFLAFHLATSLGWDAGRAITTTLLLVFIGPSVLRLLRRARRRAAFDASVAFAPSDGA